MNHKIIILCLLSAFFSIEADGKQTGLPIEKNAFDANELSSSLWDATRKSILAEGARWYVGINDSGFATEYIAGRTSHHVLHGDSLVFKGYTRGTENALLVVEGSTGQLFPLTQGRKSENTYIAELRNRRAVCSRTEGRIETEVLSEGRFIYSPGDTVKAFLTRERLFENDSTVATTYRWYAIGSRVPFAVQCDNGGTECLYTAAYDSFPGRTEDDSSESDPDLRKTILANATISKGDGHVDITLGSLPGATLEAYIVDVAGNIYGRSTHYLSSEPTTISLPTAGIGRGGCLIVMIIDGEPPLSEKRPLSL